MIDRYKVLGAYVLLSVLANVTHNALNLSDYFEFLWGCNLAALMLAIGLFVRDRDMVSGTLVLCVPGQFWWILDFLLSLIGRGFGRTGFLWEYGWLDFAFSVNLHVILIPISAYVIWRWGFSPRALWIAVGTVFFLFPLTFAITEIEDNVNCVFYGCDVADPPYSLIKSSYLPFFVLHSWGLWTLVMALSGLVFRRLFSARLAVGIIDDDALLVQESGGVPKGGEDVVDDSISIPRPAAAVEGDD